MRPVPPLPAKQALSPILSPREPAPSPPPNRSGKDGLPPVKVEVSPPMAHRPFHESFPAKSGAEKRSLPELSTPPKTGVSLKSEVRPLPESPPLKAETVRPLPEVVSKVASLPCAPALPLQRPSPESSPRQLQGHPSSQLASPRGLYSSAPSIASLPPRKPVARDGPRSPRAVCWIVCLLFGAHVV